MNTPPSSLPLPASRIEAETGSLDERILLAEARLVAREQGLRQGWQGLVQGLHRATEPRRLVMPVLGILSAVLAAVWWLRRRGASRAGAVGADVATAAALRPAASGSPRWIEFPWVRSIALVWPLLPARWRARISPATASLMVAVGLPLVAQIFRPRQHPPAVPTE